MPKISSLPADTSIASTDLMHTVKASGTRKNKKITVSTLKGYLDSSTVVDIVRDYAASTSSSDNTTVIQAAANAVPTGGTLRIPYGTFTTDEISISTRMNIEGPGTLQLKTAGENLVKVTTNNVNVNGVGFVGQAPGAAGVGSLLYYYICDGGRVSDCHFSAHSGEAAIHKAGGENINIENNEFNGIYLGPLNSSPIKMTGVNNFTVVGNRITNSYEGVLINGGNRGTISNNTIVLAAGSGLVCNPGIHIINGNTDIAVTGNSVSIPTGTVGTEMGILWESDTGELVLRGTCSGNTLYRLSWGIVIDTSQLLTSTAGPTGITVMGNSINGCSDTGILVSHKSHYNTIIGNSVVGCGYGIQNKSSDYNIILGNICKDSTLNGIYISKEDSTTSDYNMVALNTITGSGSYGMAVGTDCQFNIVQFNYLKGNGHGGVIYDDGTATQKLVNYIEDGGDSLQLRNWATAAVQLAGFYAPLMANGQAIYMALGRASSTDEAVAFAFYPNATPANSHLSIGHYGGTALLDIFKTKLDVTGDIKITVAGKGTIMTNTAGTITKRVRLNDTGDGQVYEDP